MKVSNLSASKPGLAQRTRSALTSLKTKRNDGVDSEAGLFSDGALEANEKLSARFPTSYWDSIAIADLDHDGGVVHVLVEIQISGNASEWSLSAFDSARLISDRRLVPPCPEPFHWQWH
jgi:hypothetical protein